MGRVEAFLAGDGPLPRAVCDWMCAHRRAASALAVAGRPSLPVPLARASVEHTWRSYSAAYTDIIRSSDWQRALAQLARSNVPVVLAAGARDPVPVPGRAAELARRHPGLRVLTHPRGDHGLPLTHPAWCTDVVIPLIR
ncbi:MAG: alpha/beta hydrolase [Actinomycetota bacterium]|nr:alpha/beta hydrolase [Actinomycetota bacterium]